jgi:hypothetical protein
MYFFRVILDWGLRQAWSRTAVFAGLGPQDFNVNRDRVRMQAAL